MIWCDHTCDSVGYVVYRRKDVLKDEFRGLSGPELKRLRTESTEPLTRSVRKPLLTFMSDTTPRAFDDAEWLEAMPVVITECTFLKEEHRVNAERTKHTLWSDLEPVIRTHPTTTFILIHFSHQYTSHGIESFFKNLEDPPSNIVVWFSNEQG